MRKRTRSSKKVADSQPEEASSSNNRSDPKDPAAVAALAKPEVSMVHPSTAPKCTPSPQALCPPPVSLHQKSQRTQSLLVETGDDVAELRGKPVRSQEEKEKQLLEQGSNLTGDALKTFLSNKLLNFDDSDDDDDDADRFGDDLL